MALRCTLRGFDAGVFSGDDCARIAEELASTSKACIAAQMPAAARAAERRTPQEKAVRSTGASPARQSLTRRRLTRRPGAAAP
jgi:hypothetical protein